MLIVEKAWKSVSQTTIFNCFRKSGFCVNTPDEELQVMQPTPWESHPLIGDVPFEDFVHVDDEVAVWGTLTDADILAAKDEEQPDVDNDEEDQEFPPVTLKEASTSLEKLRHFSLQTEVGPEVFDALFVLNKVVDEARINKKKQSKITDFFN
ncbi:hypothetical protein J6590_056766 [Homalodisca vitripennis]|nr:hypothetical protein J6590_056766 [Homalodisca vitripennis]